jgi:hypothetical protein
MIVVPMFLGLGFSVFGGFVYARSQTVYRQVQSSPLVPIAKLPPSGPVVIAGRVVEGEDGLTKTAIGEHPCVWFRSAVQELIVIDSYGKTDWSTLASERGGNGFYLEDGSGGRARIAYPPGADLAVHLFESPPFSEANPKIEAFLESHSKKSTALIGRKRLRVQERILKAGDEVYVYGTCRREPVPDAGTTASEAKRGSVADQAVVEDGPEEAEFRLTTSAPRRLASDARRMMWFGIFTFLAGLGAIAYGMAGGA